LPHQLDELPKREKAFIIASVQIRVENEDKQNKELKKKAAKRR